MTEEELTVVVQALRELRLRLNVESPERRIAETLVLRALATGSLEKKVD